MKFILGSIFRIVDDRIPVATRGVGATGGCGATRRSPLRVSCLLSSTIIALPNGNGVNIGILATISTIWYADLKSRAMAPMDGGDDFLIFVLSSSVGIQNFEPLQFCPPTILPPDIYFSVYPFGDRGLKSGHDGTDGLGFWRGFGCRDGGCGGDPLVAPTGRFLSLIS